MIYYLIILCYLGMYGNLLETIKLSSLLRIQDKILPRAPGAQIQSSRKSKRAQRLRTPNDSQGCAAKLTTLVFLTHLYTYIESEDISDIGL